MAKYYFRKDDEYCHEIKAHLDYMRENEIKEMEVSEAERETGSEYFFCKYFDEVGLVGESCGKECKNYEPNNGKNGRCKHYGYVYSQTDIKRILKLV
jgi:hypothetical protein